MTTMIDATQSTAPQGIDALAARVKAIATSPNLCDKLTDADLTKLANSVIQGFDIDEASMGDWKERMQRGLDLAMLVKTEKNYPWESAANIRYPLITSAALQYNARAYPAIVPSSDVVKVSVQGQDAKGQKSGRAKRVASYMSWQLKVDSREWERGTDQLTLQLPIVGDVFRKIWWDVTTNRVRSQIRLPGKHVVINNNATTLGNAPRVSDMVDLYPHEVKTKMLSGRFRAVNIPTKPEDDHSPESFIEQLCRHDLDNDGYPEPYIVTVHKETQQVVRVVAAYDMDTVRIDGERIIGVDPVPYMVHYQFMPAMDGGLLGTGMGLLLGDISETINSTLNMIMDSGHLSSLGGGFIGAQNFRIKGGVQRVRPGEYKQVNVSGDDIRRSIVDMQFPGPSPVLFQMLGMLIDSGREITSVSNVMTGDAGQRNMPVGTVMALIEQGQMVFTASYKRIYLALQDEFALIARLNAKNLDPARYNAFLDGEQPADPAVDFALTDMDILPVADPNSVTSMQKMGRAQFLLDLADRKMVDPAEVARRVLDAASVENPDALMPQPDPNAMKQQALMMAAQEEMMVIDLQMKGAELEKLEAETLAIIAKAERDAAEVDLLPMRKRVQELQMMKEALNARRIAIDEGRNGRLAQPSGDGAAAGNPAQGGGIQPGITASPAMGQGVM
jgi:chaperonin GroES